MKVPEGWARTSPNDAVVFTDKLNAIRMESDKRGSALTVASARRTAGGLQGAKANSTD